MAYIYKIVNDVNDKIYVGKTERTLEQRFNEHCYEMNRRVEENRPLYAAMRKYGVEHFHIELIEETNSPEEREIYWIEQLRSYKKGYNATLGGDGKRYIDYDKVVALYNMYHNCVTVSKIMGIGKDTVSKILHSQHIDILTPQEINKKRNEKIVAMYVSLEELPIQVFSSYCEAARYLLAENMTTAKSVEGIAVHVRDAAIGRRKTAYKHYWKLL